MDMVTLICKKSNQFFKNLFFSPKKQLVIAFLTANALITSPSSYCYSETIENFSDSLHEQAKLDYQQGINTFSFDVLQQRMTASTTDNQLISPLGISFLLSMIKHAVGPEDQVEIERIIHLPQDEVELQVSAHALMKKLMDNGVDIAGLLYINDQYELNPHYQSLISTYYQGKAEKGSSAKEINAWVQQITQGQIKEMITQKDLSGFLVVLANAIHFKADWIKPFQKGSTYPEDFMTPHKVIQTQMMHKTDKFGYFEDDFCQAIKLAYRGSGCSMLLILPKIDNDFSFLDASQFEVISQGLKVKSVKISLPKFKLEQEVDVKEMLQAMGMIHLFQRPDFSALVDLSHAPSRAILPNLVISKIKQKSALACDEKGTEASSVTMGTIALTHARCPEKNLKEVTFNRPFFVALTGAEVPILYGVIRDPS